MNVLIITPDRVGSTLLQRLITVYMLRREFDKPVINLHELTNGLVKYYNTDLNQEVLGKPKGTDWGYFQSLTEVTELLKSTDHYKTSRLAHYHIVNRQDTIEEQIPFYEFLNNNFFIISCRRKNVFEHALSWCIQAHSKKLNVYNPIEKIQSFDFIYKHGININKLLLEKHLNNYKNYIEWADRYFNVQSYFNYDDDIHNVEDYILNLDFMKGHSHCDWKSMFGQEFKDFNTCHKLIPDLLLYENSSNTQLKLSNPHISPDLNISNHNGLFNLSFSDPVHKETYNLVKGSDWPEFNDLNNSIDKLDSSVRNEIINFKQQNELYWENPSVKISKEVAVFLEKNLETYKTTFQTVNKLVDQGFLVTGIPIKLQSLQEKKAVINNFTETINWYNEWVERNNFGEKYNEDQLEKVMLQENSKLVSPFTPRLAV